MIFDPHTVSLLKSTLRDNGSIDLESQGTSMFPVIRSGDVCRFVPFYPNHLKKGDVILFWTETRQLVAHRFYYSLTREGKLFYFCKGDTNLGFDQPITVDRILGTLQYIKKDNKKVYRYNLLTYLWGLLIMHIPLLPKLIRKYLNKRSVLI